MRLTFTLPFFNRRLSPWETSSQLGSESSRWAWARWAWDFLKKNCQKVSMKFGQFSNSSTSYPIITKCTASWCIWYWNCNYWVSLKTVQISLILLGNFFQKISGPSSLGPSRIFRHLCSCKNFLVQLYSIHEIGCHLVVVWIFVPNMMRNKASRL